jgi:hypothetical protein
MTEPAHPGKANVDYRLLKHWNESRRIQRAGVSGVPVRHLVSSELPRHHPALVEGARRIVMPLEDR